MSEPWLSPGSRFFSPPFRSSSALQAPFISLSILHVMHCGLAAFGAAVGGALVFIRQLAAFITFRMSNAPFPTPWTVEQDPGGYKVKDASGQSPAFMGD
jgi:hypothetical protein